MQHFFKVSILMVFFLASTFSVSFAQLPWIKDANNPVLSYRIGYLKPEPKIYLAAAESVETTPQQCLFIDDREINVDGAQSLGMQSIQFTGIEKLRQDLAALGILSM